MTSNTPRDAAAVILLRKDSDPNNPEVFWVKRSTKLSFLGGYHAFPGGQREPGDSTITIRNCSDPERAAMISCAAREVFEEIGVLLARGSEALTKGQRASLLDDLESARMSWPELLNHYGLQLDDRDFTFVGRWVTPPFAPRRFDTWFFLVDCPAKQDAAIAEDSELQSGEWIFAREALRRWKANEIIVVPPVLHAMKTLGDGLNNSLIQRFLSIPEAHGQPTRRIEFHPHYICFPLRTPTKPPATHTNCYLIYTDREIQVIDPGSPYEDEQQALITCIDDLISEGRTVREIVLTHVHPDHVAGVETLKVYLATKQESPVAVAAHQGTTDSPKYKFPVDRFIEDNQILTLNGQPEIHLRALFTPGHARGHLCFFDERTGALLSGDNIVGFGSVLIDPPDGNMRDYLASLERMRALENLSVLFGGHGPAIANPYEKIDEYIAHRQVREEMVLDALKEGAATPPEIVARAYLDVSPKAHAMAERAVIAHLEKLIADKLVIQMPDETYRQTTT